MYWNLGAPEASSAEFGVSTVVVVVVVVALRRHLRKLVRYQMETANIKWSAINLNWRWWRVAFVSWKTDQCRLK